MSSELEKVNKIKSLLNFYEEDDVHQFKLESIERNQFYNVKIEKMSKRDFVVIITAGALGSIGRTHLAYSGTERSCIDKAREIKKEHMEAGFKFSIS